MSTPEQKAKQLARQQILSGREPRLEAMIKRLNLGPGEEHVANQYRRQWLNSRPGQAATRVPVAIGEKNPPGSRTRWGVADRAQSWLKKVTRDVAIEKFQLQGTKLAKLNLAKPRAASEAVAKVVKAAKKVRGFSPAGMAIEMMSDPKRSSIIDDRKKKPKPKPKPQPRSKAKWGATPTPRPRSLRSRQYNPQRGPQR
jgi:hypothetical protein